MKFLLFCFLCVSIISCSNDNEVVGVDLSGRFEPEGIINYDAPMMYVRNQAISDTSIINTYLRSRNELGRFVYNSTGPATPIYWSIEFVSDDSMKIFNPVGNNTTGFRMDINRPNNRDILINRRDSFVFANNTDPLLNSRCSTLIVLANSYAQRINRYAAYYVQYPTYYFQEISNSLYIPLASFVTHYRNPANGEICVWSGNNFPGSIIKQNFPVTNLIQGDTIVLQTHRVRLRRV